MRRFDYTNDAHGNTQCSVFDSLSDMTATCEAIPAERSAIGAQSIDDSDFIGREFANVGEAFAAMHTVWAEGIQIVERMTRELDSADLPKPVSRKRKPRFDETDGDELDYDRLRTGQPFWRTSRRQNTRGPATITVVVDVCANCSVKAKDILWRGAAAVALTKRLEEAGYRVELWAAAYSLENYHSTSGFVAVCLKRPSEPLDESTLINAVSGWGFRSLWFQASCLGERPIKGNLGRARTPGKQELDQITPDANRVLIADAFTYESAVAKVRQAIQTITSK